MEDNKDPIPSVKGARHLLQDAIAQPTGPISIRGNVFSFYCHGINSCVNCQTPLQRMMFESGQWIKI
eukprot:6017960-Karenia_brevis.AAC.1